MYLSVQKTYFSNLLFTEFIVTSAYFSKFQYFFQYPANHRNSVWQVKFGTPQTNRFEYKFWLNENEYIKEDTLKCNLELKSLK